MEKVIACFLSYESFLQYGGEENATECFFEYGVVLTKLEFTDASKQFWKYHNEDVLKKYQDRLKIGELKEEAKL